MTNFNIKPQPIDADLLLAILAKLTIGDLVQSENFNKLLDTLPVDDREAIAQRVLKYDLNTNLNELGNSKLPSSDKRFTLYSAADALLPQPPMDWIVDQLFSPGTVSFFEGEPGCKKTYSLIDLAVNVATGRPWLGYKTKQGSVLIIDEESGKRRMDKRLREAMRHYSADEQTPIWYTTLENMDLLSEKDVASVLEIINDKQCTLVIIDALADVMPGADENTVKDVQPLLMNLRGLAEKTGSAIVVIHHSNKNGGFRGSSALLGAADTWVTVESKVGQNAITFKTRKNRDGEPLEFYAQANFQDEMFWLSPKNSKPVNIISISEQKILLHYSTRGPGSNKDININDVEFPTIKKDINGLVRTGYLKRIDGGGPGKRATYDITDKGKEVVNSFKPDSATCNLSPHKGGITG